MFEQCGKSFCEFMHKCFNLKNKKRLMSFKINTSRVINSSDLNTYLFADECETCKNRNLISKSKNKKNGNYNNNDEDLGIYQPPIISTCESFVSIDSSDGDSGSDLEVDDDINDRVKSINMKNIKIKDGIALL
jgi:CRISPR/Cas system-associated protein Cas10 (large subunit of type III CRISPR-Cas system)